MPDGNLFAGLAEVIRAFDMLQLFLYPLSLFVERFPASNEVSAGVTEKE